MDTTMLRVNGVCNAGCPFCALSEDPGLTGERLQKAFDALTADVAQGARHLRIGGGEPMLVSNLPDIIRKARSLGFDRVTLETNATIASLPGRVEALVAAGLTDVLASLNSSDPVANSAVYGFDDGGGASLKGLRAFLNAGSKVMVRTPLSVDNLKDLEAIPSFLRSELPRVDEWWLRPLVRSQDAPFEGRHLPSLERLAQALPRALLAARRAGLEVRVEDVLGLPLCILRSSPGLLRHLDRRSTTDRHFKTDECASCAVVDRCQGQPRDYSELYGAYPVRPFENPPKVVDRRATRPERIITYHQTGHGGQKAPGPQVTIRVIMPCNQACTFCFVDRSSASPSPQIVFDALDAAAKAGADRISFSGGEPTLHPRLVDYIGRARSLDIDGIEIQTNALRLTDPSLCDALVEAGLNKAVVSLHAVDPERYLRITGAGTPDEVMHGIRNLLDRGVRVEVNVVHCDDNLDHLQDIMERIADRIPEVLVLLSVTYIVEGVSRDWQKVAIRYTDAVPYLADALRSARERNLAIRLTGRCSVPPCAWHGRLEELQHVDIADVHQDDTEDGHVFFDTCNSCAARKHCYGISQDYVQNFGQEEFKAIPADLWQQVLGARD